MRPATIPLITDLKKEWKFLWVLSTPTRGVVGTYQDYANWDLKDIADLTVDASDGSTLYRSTVCNPLFRGYVSQLAETVNLPDDEFENEEIPQGPVTYSMPKKVKLSDINVTYLDDSLESVYNFHKAWYQAIRCGRTVGINSPSLYCASARYIPFEDTLTALEYAAYKNEIMEYVNSAISTVNLAPNLPLYAKPTSITTYPKIYPIRIHRSAANHAGSDTSKVEVTYKRIPVFEKKHSALQTWDSNLNIWKNSSSNSY